MISFYIYIHRRLARAIEPADRILTCQSSIPLSGVFFSFRPSVGARGDVCAMGNKVAVVVGGRGSKKLMMVLDGW